MKRARVALAQGNGEEAVRCFQRAFQLNPQNSNTGFALFTELHGQNRHDEANVVWERLQQLKRFQHELKLLIGEAAKDQRNAPLRYRIGMLLLETKAEAAALRWFMGALQADPNYQPAHATLADYYERKGEAELASYHRGLASRGR